MRFSLKVSVAVHILLVAHFFSESVRITGKLLTYSTGCNPVVVRTLVRSLKNSGILEVPRGPQGGARLLKAPGEITLWDIYASVDPESMCDLVKGVHATSSTVCPVGKRIQDVLKGPYGRIASVIESEMRGISLEDLFQGLSMDEIASHKARIAGQPADDSPDSPGPPDDTLDL
jgi:DNA-binding IscR family transcriptional regulator